MKNSLRVIFQKSRKYLSLTLVVGLLTLTGLVRAYRFNSSLVFDSDFGRDTLFAVRILEDKPTLLGAKASVGGFYLGPLYFYGIALLFSIFGYLPQVLSLAFVAMNVLAAYLIFRFLKTHVSETAGLYGLALFALNPLLVFSARGATHIPMLPLITVISVVVLYRALIRRELVWFFLAGIAFGLYFHVHFSSLLYVPGYFLAVLLWGGDTFWQRLRAAVAVSFGMLFMLTPLILFDVRHDFITGRAFVDYLLSSAAGGEIVENMPHWSLPKKIVKLVRLMGPGLALPIGLVGVAGWGVFQGLKKKVSQPSAMKVLLLLFGSVGLFYLLYNGYLYTYYLIIPLTLGLLVVAAGLGRLRHQPVSGLLVLVVCLASIHSLRPFYSNKYRTLPHLSQVVESIEQHIDENEMDKFTVFKDSEDGMTGLAYEYRFLLRRDGYIPVFEESYDRAEVLYVIREDGNVDPLALGNWEVQQFDPKRAELVDKFAIEGKEVDVFALYKN